jgi:hypothetical protein
MSTPGKPNTLTLPILSQRRPRPQPKRRTDLAKA